MIRVLCFIGGLTGAAGLSQFPEFSQQYLQRLAGQVDELTRQVVEFDQTALADGMGREEMLQAMAETPLVAGQEQMWRRSFARHARLSENLMILREASPIARLTMPQRMADPATLQAVWVDFTPAVPLSAAGAAATGAGFLTGWAGFAALFAVLTMPLRRNATKRSREVKRREPAVKTEPPLNRPRLVAQNGPPRLAGARR